MPILINEMTTEIAPAIVPASEAKPLAENMSVQEPEYELLQTLQLIEERRLRLQFD